MLKFILQENRNCTYQGEDVRMIAVAFENIAYWNSRHLRLTVSLGGSFERV